jgi:lysophospholipase L1-like esterase
MPRPSPEELRRRRLIAGLLVFGVVVVIVVGGALAFGGGGSSDTSAAPTRTTAPPTTAVPTTTLVPVKITAIGDSVMLGAADALRVTLGIDRTTVDAAESRQFSAGVDKIQEYKDAGDLGDEVVVQLGTNGTVNPDDFTRMMQILKDTKRVVIINAKVPRPWEDEVNQVLGDGVKQYKNAVLVDWNTVGSQHPEWFYDDGLHLRPDGAQAYAQLVASKAL